MSDPKPEQQRGQPHVDTPEQAAARQLINTDARVTHVFNGALPLADEQYSLLELLPEEDKK